MSGNCIIGRHLSDDKLDYVDTLQSVSGCDSIVSTTLIDTAVYSTVRVML